MTKKEEKELIASVERGEWKPVKNREKEMLRLREAARETLRKDARINIRLTKRDFFNLKSKAVREGMPYQTLVSSVIHKYLTGQLAS
ncbi:MAG: antitoxin [Candidatus Omnitrophica bacterium]|nr:antitoxin [Candidatus Omnitrophota bacterium]MDE2009650.1 antitoxin [Candidatus Omnitrophota bacterium]MDE2214422.1 antitoxin [Candidatus Omnitrophota bacterium]MDE2231562.1 antitoxin [Candidatus Omnitrophota bacterium]